MPYPTPPATRIAYDLDGSFGVAQNMQTLEWVDVPQAALTALNNERGGGAGSQGSQGLFWTWQNIPSFADTARLVILLPVATRLRGVLAMYAVADYYFVSGRRGGHGHARVETSPDTTNGVDGTWTTVAPELVTSTTPSVNLGKQAEFVPIAGVTAGLAASGGYSLNDEYRRFYPDHIDGIVAVAGAATRQVRGIRISTTVRPNSVDSYNATFHLHLYGEPDTEAITQRLEFWQESSDLRVSADYMGWGDVPLASTEDKTFRIRNMSPTDTANLIVVEARAAASTTTPSPHGFLTFSDDGGTSWDSSITILALGPETTSAPIMVRRVVPSGAILSNWSPRIIANAGSWS